MTDAPEPVHRLFAVQQPGPVEADVTRDYVSMARAVAAICATRILLLIAVIAGTGVWGFTIIEPTRDRLLAAIAFSVAFVLPQVALYWKRG